MELLEETFFSKSSFLYHILEVNVYMDLLIYNYTIVIQLLNHYNSPWEKKLEEINKYPLTKVYKKPVSYME